RCNVTPCSMLLMLCLFHHDGLCLRTKLGVLSGVSGCSFIPGGLSRLLSGPLTDD
ncbi:hypothetical protein STEG23_007990, partial [Scotinomys teguina]